MTSEPRVENGRVEDERKPRPDYPPKTPPPPKKPPSPPPPEREMVRSYGPLGAGTLAGARGRMTVTMASRQGANWMLDASPWGAPYASGKAVRLVVDQLTSWGYRPDTTTVTAVVNLLVPAALADGGRRISVHLADQDHRALILVLSHHDLHQGDDDALLHELAAAGVVSCGIDTDRDGGGHRRWALIEL
ncbi:hypothetical protein [Streptomyces sp. NBC_01465]|uniref:hypothetical protein n=1 Tax=Streptomyces sp. NBC_01465 TaxID=2903878 RepID=UPI002E377161|nr:hypothetical protein [Streptomyces sp. NBC_01465]